MDNERLRHALEYTPGTAAHQVIADGVRVCLDCPARIEARRLRCPPCAKRRAAALKKARYDGGYREQARVNQRAYYRRNREAALAYARRQNYGISEEEFTALIEAQGGDCPVCLEPLGTYRIAVDHCHETGRVRGILHGPCNSGMGHLADDPERCERAAEYLRRHRGALPAVSR